MSCFSCISFFSLAITTSSSVDILERSQTKIGADLEITEDAVWKAKYVILKKMANLLGKVEAKTL